MNFRHLLAKHELGGGLMAGTSAHLAEQGLREGTILDATIIAAPSSTKNKRRSRDRQMQQMKKGNQWPFGLKAHIGVDAETGPAHSVAATAANVADVTQAHELLHGGEKMVCGDAGYQGVAKRAEQRGRKAGAVASGAEVWAAAALDGRQRGGAGGAAQGGATRRLERHNTAAVRPQGRQAAAAGSPPPPWGQQAVLCGQNRWNSPPNSLETKQYPLFTGSINQPTRQKLPCSDFP